MTDVEHVDDIGFDGKQDPIDMWSAPVQELTYFDGRVLVLRSQRAPGRMILQSGDRGAERYEPPLSGISSVLRSKPVVNRGDVVLSLCG
jgi:hypothetical protein